MDKKFEKKWMIAQIKPNSCSLAIRNLERQGFETFDPRTKTTIKRKNKFIYKETSVFSGYIFVSISLKSPIWSKINSTYGVSKLLIFNNKPSEVPLDFMVALKKRFEDNINPTIDENLKRGDTIKFHNGPFADLVANIESIDAKKRIYVLLEVMGGRRKLEINLKEEINFIKI